MAGDAKTLSPVKFAASIGGAEPGSLSASSSMKQKIHHKVLAIQLIKHYQRFRSQNLLVGTRRLQQHIKCALHHQVRPSTRCAKTNHSSKDSSLTRIVLLISKHDGFRGNFELRFIRLL